MLVVIRMCRLSRGFGVKNGSGGGRQIFSKRIVMRRKQIFYRIRKATNT